MSRATRLYVLAVLSLLALGLVATRFGSTPDLDFDLIVQLRLPRVLLAIAVGAGLAVAGTTLQALFANPLCEPYTLGISSGAALGAVMGGSLGVELSYAGLTGPAFVGALVFALILHFISKGTGRKSQSILLAGVMLGFLGSSLVALWMALADSQGIQGALIWLLGSLSRARPQGAVLTLIAVVSLSAMIWRDSRALDGLLMGEEDARALGVEVDGVRRRLLLLSSLLIGACVTAGGMIGFIGLVVPHFARRSIGSLHRRLLPLAALWGASVLVGSDLIARTLARPNELPVGILTALIGAPLFMMMMLSERGQES